MIRNIKGLGLAFVAAAAMSVVAASGAQATQFHAAASPSATINGSQTVQHNFKLTTSSAETKCSNATFEGTIQGGSGGTTTVEEGALTPTYSQCLTAGLTSQVIMNGCKYTITGKNGAQTLTKTAWVDITGCTVGKTIEIKLLKCTITVPEQTSLSHLVFAQSGNNVLVQVTMQGITYEFHREEFPVEPCPRQIHGGQPKIPSEHTKLTHDGDYTGTVTLSATQDPSIEQKTEHSHQFTKHKVGTQVALTVT